MIANSFRFDYHDCLGSADVRGLFEFTRRFPRYEPLIVCAAQRMLLAERLGVKAVTWQQFLLGGPAGVTVA